MLVCTVLWLQLHRNSSCKFFLDSFGSSLTSLSIWSFWHWVPCSFRHDYFLCCSIMKMRKKHTHRMNLAHQNYTDNMRWSKKKNEIWVQQHWEEKEEEERRRSSSKEKQSSNRYAVRFLNKTTFQQVNVGMLCNPKELQVVTTMPMGSCINRCCHSDPVNA